MQIRFSGKNFKQVDLAAGTITAEIPAGTKNAILYLYSHAAPTPEFQIRSVKVEVSAEAFPIPKADPREVAGALTDMKRDLCIPTALVKNGKPAAVIAVPVSQSPTAQMAETLNFFAAFL